MEKDKNNQLEHSEIISKSPIFESKFFSVERVKLKRNGKEFEKDIIERVPFVLIVPLSNNNEVYLVKQYRDALEKVSLEVVAGMLNDKDEDPLDAAKRELREEAGITASEWKQVAKIHVSSNMKGTAHIFAAKGLTHGETDFDDDEELQTVKMPLNEALEKIVTGEIDVASNIAALLLVDKLHSQGKL